MRHDTWAKAVADKHGNEKAHEICNRYINKGFLVNWYKPALDWLLKHRPLPPPKEEVA